MKVNIGAIGKFHSFDLARELFKRGHLGEIYSAYPRIKLRKEEIPWNKIRTFPYVYAPYMAGLARAVSTRTRREWERLSAVTFDEFVARNVSECDVFVGLSGSAFKAGCRVQSYGGKYVCDRGSTHIRYQNELLREENEIVGLQYDGIDSRAIDQEEREYAAADFITVPSAFNFSSFLKHQIPESKLRKLPYGVNLTRFYPVGRPDAGRFDVLFVGALSTRKGVHYLVDAFGELEAKNKTLHLVGSIEPAYAAMLRQKKSWSNSIKLYGAIPQPQLKKVMSRCHVMVLPSIEEGLAMVQAQAMACGCPVISTENTGARDLYSDSVEGFIVPIRSAAAIAEKLQRLADFEDERSDMAESALIRVKSIGGWRQYGDNAIKTYEAFTRTNTKI